MVMMMWSHRAAAMSAVLLAARPACRRPAEPQSVKFETVTLRDEPAPATLNIAFRPGAVPRHPAILMPGAIKEGRAARMEHGSGGRRLHAGGVFGCLSARS